MLTPLVTIHRTSKPSVGQKRLGYYAGHQQASRCRTRSDSEEPIAWSQGSSKMRSPSWLWNPGKSSPKVQKRGISGPSKRIDVLPIIFKKKKTSEPCGLWYGCYVVGNLSNDIVNDTPFIIKEKYTLHTTKSNKISFQVFSITTAKLFKNRCVKKQVVGSLMSLKIVSESFTRCSGANNVFTSLPPVSAKRFNISW